MKPYFKDFDGWNAKAKEINNKSLPSFKEAEIWWCSIGVNISHEIDGKSKNYTRPVLVLKKFNRELFFGIPLTTAEKRPEIQYHFFLFNGKKQCALLAQSRTFDAARLTHRMGKLGETEFNEIKRGFANVLKI